MPLLQTPDFPETTILYCLKNFLHRKTYDKSKSTNISPNRYQLLGLTSENIELVPENIQETDIAVSCVSGGKCSFFGKFDMLCFLEKTVLRFAVLPYYRRCQTKNRNALTSENIGNKRPSVVNNKHLQRQTDFLWLRVVPGTKSFSETSRPSKGHLKHFDIY